MVSGIAVDIPVVDDPCCRTLQTRDTHSRALLERFSGRNKEMNDDKHEHCEVCHDDDDKSLCERSIAYSFYPFEKSVMTRAHMLVFVLVCTFVFSFGSSTYTSDEAEALYTEWSRLNPVDTLPILNFVESLECVRPFGEGHAVGLRWYSVLLDAAVNAMCKAECVEYKVVIGRKSGVMKVVVEVH